MAGIYVAGMRELGVPPSTHYGGHFIGISPELNKLVSTFIDGAAAASTDEVLVLPFEIGATFARVAVCDRRDFQSKKCFVVALWARTEQDLAATPEHRDRRGTPMLLSDLHEADAWLVYNCQLTLVPWDVDSLDSGSYPPL